MNQVRRRISLIFLLSLLALCMFCVSRVQAQEVVGHRSMPGSELQQLVDTPSVSGYERAIAQQIRSQIASYHPAVDNLGDVIVTIGSGSPHRLLVAPVDEPGFVVSDIKPDGYLCVQRLPQTGLPPIFNALYVAQPVQIETTSGKWINGVVAGTSIHLHAADDPESNLSSLDNMYIDIGATSANEVRAAGVDVLSPVVIDGGVFILGGSNTIEPKIGFSIGQPEIQNVTETGRSVGDKFGAAALVELLQRIDPATVKGTLTVAFVAQQRTGARGLQRILRNGQFDEMIYVGRLTPGGAIPGMKDVHRAPRREPGSGVLIGLSQTNGTLSGFSAELQQLAAANKIPLTNDYSSAIIPDSYIASPPLSSKWAHLGIAVSWPDTPIESIDAADLNGLASLLQDYVNANAPPGKRFGEGMSNDLGPRSGPPSMLELLARLVSTYGASNHEGPVREEVKNLLPRWAKTETDSAGNLILHLGAAPADSKAAKILVVAHMDEIGFQVKSIADNGLLDISLLGGMDLNYYEGHPILVHTATGDRWGILELPNGWDLPDFNWPADSSIALRVDVGARNPAEVAKLGIKISDSITVPKEYRPLLGTFATARSFDDRVGDAALISAVWALGHSLSDRDVTFVWSTGEELGLDGAQALAKRLAAEGQTPDYVFAVDTFVSSDSPVESKRFADAELGKGFVVRAVDTSNIVPRNLVERVVKLAHENRIPVQYGVTGGGNDGAAFVQYGSIDVALGWPMRYSHSPAEEIDTRDADALAHIIAVIAKSW